MPVGFVGAAESKEALIADGRVPYLCVRGRKGGSAMTAAADQRAGECQGMTGRPTGRLFGIGLGPGDPELLTVKAVRLIQAASVVGYFAKAGRRGNAREIVDRWMTGNAEELPLLLPDDDRACVRQPGLCQRPGRVLPTMPSPTISAHLDAGRDVALLSEGDPLFYGSFMHLYIRLRPLYPVTLVPGVMGMAGCWSARRRTHDLGRRHAAGAAGHFAAGRADRPAARHRRGGDHEAGPQLRQGPRRRCRRPGCWTGRSTSSAARWRMRS